MIWLPRGLWNVGWRYLRGHRLQSLLMVLGIALGVAVMVSIDLANASAARAFELSAESIAGRATHQIEGGPDGVDESLYVRLRREGLAQQAAPVISSYVISPQLGSRPLQLIGVDPFVDAPFRSYLGEGQAPPVSELTAFLTRPGAVLLAQEVAQRYGLALGAPLTLEIDGRSRQAFVAGLLTPEDALARRSLDGVLVADIAVVQELTNRTGRVDRIDLILPANDPAAVERIRAQLPQGVRLAAAAARSGALEQMTAAFRLNLTALSMLALLVGLFLIYNTMTFSVVQRRPLFGTLRCLGVTRREVFWMVLSEALVVGVFGSALGIGLGVLMGQSTVGMVTQTINDLYFTTTVRAVGLPISSLIKGGVVGILATIFTAVPPAVEAASVPPRTALSRSGLEGKARRLVGWLALAGAVLIGLGLVLFNLNNAPMALGFAGTFVVVVGFAMLAPLTLVGVSRLATPVLGAVFGLLGRMAPRNLVNALSRTSVAVAALMVAVAVTVGVSLMIDSFRYTVTVWLGETLQSDVYVSAPSFTATTATTAIDPQIVQRVQTWPGVARADLLRSTQVETDRGSVQLSATDNPCIGQERLFAALAGSREQVWPQMQAGAVLISEPLANRLALKSGDVLRLFSDSSWHDFTVQGIFYDYASSEGTVFMAWDVYQRWWQDEAVTAIGLRLQPGVDADAISQSMQDAFGPTQRLFIRPNQALRRDVMSVFDRTFAITSALRLLATGVAFIGVLSALLLLQLEKTREVGILRALGLTRGQLWRLVMMETSLMGFVAGILAAPTGYALALILVYVINRRSFGWTLQLSIQPVVFLQALGIALLAALLAGILPARRLGRMAAAEAIRYE